MSTQPSVTSANIPPDTTWSGYVALFANADKMMGNLFHLKVKAIGGARKLYIKKNGKAAGFVKKFAADAQISHDYASQINRIEKTFPECTTKNFSHDAAKLLLSVPADEREEFLEQHGDNPVTVTDVKEFKELSQLEDDVDEGIEFYRESGIEVERTKDGVFGEFSGDQTKEEFVAQYKTSLEEERDNNRPITTTFKREDNDDDDFEVIEAVEEEHDFKPVPVVKTSLEGQVKSLFGLSLSTTQNFSAEEVTEYALQLIAEKPEQAEVFIPSLKAYLPILQHLIATIENEIPKGTIQ